MTLFGSVKLCAYLSIAAILLAIYYRRVTDQEIKRQISTILSSLLKAEIKPNTSDHSSKRNIIVGVGICKDVFIDSIKFFDTLNISSPTENNFQYSDTINNIQDFTHNFAYFFKRGAAAERYIANKTFWYEIVKSIEELSYKWAIGGNAPVIAKRIASEVESDVTLAGYASKSLYNDLADKLKLVGKIIDFDDIHAIFEYERGVKWGSLVSPRANRFIVHSDYHNLKMSVLTELENEFSTHTPDIFILGGLQMLDSAEGDLDVRLKSISRLERLIKDTSSIMVHFELASFAEKDFFNAIIRKIIPYSHSLGMNEQELENLYSMLKEQEITLVSNPHPRIANVLDNMRFIWKYLSSTSNSKLSRLHVHTLAFQTIMTRKNTWPNTMKATAKSSLTAYRHTCASGEIDIERAALLMDESFAVSKEEGSKRISFNEEKPIACWQEDFGGEGEGENVLVDICVAPVLVCTNVRQTAGGGDNISAAALAMQI